MAGTVYRAGEGIELFSHTEYYNGDKYEVVTISKSGASKILPYEIDVVDGKPGDVLMINDYHGVSWNNPFEKDEDLRNANPSLQLAYENLLVALQEYEMVKKMVKDHG